MLEVRGKFFGVGTLHLFMGSGYQSHIFMVTWQTSLLAKLSHLMGTKWFISCISQFKDTQWQFFWKLRVLVNKKIWCKISLHCHFLSLKHWEILLPRNQELITLVTLKSKLLPCVKHRAPHKSPACVIVLWNFVWSKVKAFVKFPSVAIDGLVRARRSNDYVFSIRISSPINFIHFTF